MFAVFPKRDFNMLADAPHIFQPSKSKVLMDLAMGIALSLTPLLRMFLHLGLQRVWFQSGDVLFHQVRVAVQLVMPMLPRPRTVVDN